jgi:hypothetical protein
MLKELMLKIKKTEKWKVIFRFIPKVLERLFLVKWLIMCPTKMFLTSYLQMRAAVEELRFKLFPSTDDRPSTSSTLSKGLKRNTRLYLGHGFGIEEHRDSQTTFTAGTSPFTVLTLQPTFIANKVRNREKDTLIEVMPSTYISHTLLFQFINHVTLLLFRKWLAALSGCHCVGLSF